MRRDFEIASNIPELIFDDNENYTYPYSIDGDGTSIQVPSEILGTPISEVELRIYNSKGFNNQVYTNTFPLVSGMSYIQVPLGKEAVKNNWLISDTTLRYEIRAVEDTQTAHKRVLLYGDLIRINPLWDSVNSGLEEYNGKFGIGVAVNINSTMTTLTFVKDEVYMSYEELEDDTAPHILTTPSIWLACDDGVLANPYIELDRTSYNILKVVEEEYEGEIYTTIFARKYYTCEFPASVLYRYMVNYYADSSYKITYGDEFSENYTIVSGNNDGSTLLYGTITYNATEPYQVQLHPKDFTLLKRADTEYSKEQEVTKAITAYTYEEYPELYFWIFTQQDCNIYHGGIYAPVPVGENLCTQLGEDILTEDDSEILT